MAKLARNYLSQLPVFEPGTVWLTGAGPGDPGLLTLHALNGLEQAEIIVRDALVSSDILALAGTGAKIIHAGKRGGKPSPTQRDISLRLIEWARKGARVLRLKGGDPFVFGRGGEEALALAKAHIGFRIIPGVTSGIGGLAYAGIPVTHRDTNQVVSFLTGHDQSGLTPSAVDWLALSRASPVIVIYMALKHLGEIVRQLRSAGRPASEPVAVIYNATLSDQRNVITTLSEVNAAISDIDMAPPAIICVGQVVRLRAGLDWLGALKGKALDPDPLSQHPASMTG